MTKSTVPRGTTRKVKCKCGNLYYQVLLPNNELSDGCSICKPKQYEGKKK